MHRLVSLPLATIVIIADVSNPTTRMATILRADGFVPNNGGSAMDPGMLIVGALVPGALKGESDAAGTAVSDAYQRLRRLVARLLSSQPGAELVLVQHANDSQTWQAPLEQALCSADASSSTEIVEAAERLVVPLDEAGRRAGKYTVNLSGARGIQVGDHNWQMNSFDSSPSS
jgi:hypothetical protein